MKARQAHRFHQCRAVRRCKWRSALRAQRWSALQFGDSPSIRVSPDAAGYALGAPASDGRGVGRACPLSARGWGWRTGGTDPCGQSAVL